MVEVEGAELEAIKEYQANYSRIKEFLFGVRNEFRKIQFKRDNESLQITFLPMGDPEQVRERIEIQHTLDFTHKGNWIHLDKVFTLTVVGLMNFRTETSSSFFPVIPIGQGINFDQDKETEWRNELERQAFETVDGFVEAATQQDSQKRSRFLFFRR